MTSFFNGRPLSIGIVTFNSEKTIARALESIRACLPFGCAVQLILVDNCSSDSTARILDDHAKRVPDSACIHNNPNIGFARAHNQILASVNSCYHVICNPDISIAADIFTPMAKFLENHSEIGLCCPKFLNPDGSIQFLNRRFPTVLDLFLRRMVPAALKRLFKHRLEFYDMREVGYDHSYDVPFVSGAFMFCRTQVLKEVGGFDERFFLYFEDVDLSRRVQNHGYRTVYFPEVCVTHVWERLAHKNWRGSLMFIKSAYKYFRKWGFKWG
jgi:hypothetical protein